MQKLLITLMIVVMMFSMCAMVAHAEPEYYARVAVIIEMDEIEDVVYAVDFTGEIYSFYGCEDWSIGDIVAMVMDTMGTELVYDDEIISITYNGWINFH